MLSSQRRTVSESKPPKEASMSPRKKQVTLQEELFPPAEWAWLDRLIEDMKDGGDETRRLPPVGDDCQFKIPMVAKQPVTKVTRGGKTYATLIRVVKQQRMM